MIRQPLFAKHRLALSVGAAMLGMSSAAHSASFTVGDFDINFDSTFSYGQSIRTENRDFQFFRNSPWDHAHWNRTAILDSGVALV